MKPYTLTDGRVLDPRHLAYPVGRADRRQPPRNRKRWYRCACGLWWGKNKSFQCWCGRMPPGKP